MLKKQKKSAMFGLDARIALAIFGALSVIAGVSLITVMQNMQTVSVYNEVQEIIKAHEQYILDTGEPLKYNRDVQSWVNLNNLIEDPGITGWKGPYLQNKINPVFSYQLYSDSLKSPSIVERASITGVYKNKDAFLSSTGCTDEKDCFFWLEYVIYAPESSLNLINLFQKKLGTNNFKYIRGNGPNGTYIYFLVFKGFPVKKLH